MQTALDIRIIDVPAATFAFVVRRVGQDEIGEFIEGAIDRVRAFADRHGGTLGPPLAICSHPDEEGAIVVEAGWPVEPGTPPESPVEVRRLPRTRAVSHLHTGGYDELGPRFYTALANAAHEHGVMPIASPRELYLAPNVTEIVWPIG